MYNWSLYSTVIPQSIYWAYPWPEREQKSVICAQTKNKKKKRKKKEEKKKEKSKQTKKSALHSSITLWFVAVAKNWKQKKIKKKKDSNCMLLQLWIDDKLSSFRKINWTKTFRLHFRQ